MICGERVRVYALEKESFSVSVEGSASDFQRVAFRKVGVEESNYVNPIPFVLIGKTYL